MNGRDPLMAQVPSHRIAASTGKQSGAALATSLFFLVILTLLGLAAVRSGNVNLRLADNEGSRLTAIENAQTIVGAATSPSTLAVLPGSGYMQACVVGSDLNASKLSTDQNFTCPASLPVAFSLPETPYKNKLYVSIFREQVNGFDYVPVSALRRGDSGDRYNLASFTVTGGYDTVTTNDPAVAQGASEIAQGLYVKVARIPGLTQQ